jgi:hypothetical protein
MGLNKMFSCGCLILAQLSDVLPAFFGGARILHCKQAKRRSGLLFLDTLREFYKMPPRTRIDDSNVVISLSQVVFLNQEL